MTTMTTMTNDDHDDHDAPNVDGQADRLVTLIVGPPLLLLGLFGNGMVFVGITQLKSQFRSFVYYYVALTASGLVLLLLSLFPMWVESMADLQLEVDGNWLCKVSAFVYYSTANASSWFLAAMVVQRAVGVLWPHSVRKTSTETVCIAVILLIIIISPLLSLHTLVADTVSLEECYVGSNISLKHGGVGKIWSAINLLFAFLLPFLLIVVSNTLLIARLNSSSQRVKHMISDRTQARGKEPSDKEPLKMTVWQNILKTTRISSMTLTMMATSAVYCILISPFYFVESLEVSHNVDHGYLPTAGRVLLHHLVYANAAANFYLYCLTGRRFRRQILIILRRRLLCMKGDMTGEGGSDTYTRTTAVTRHTWSGRQRAEIASGMTSMDSAGFHSSASLAPKQMETIEVKQSVKVFSSSVLEIHQPQPIADALDTMITDSTPVDQSWDILQSVPVETASVSIDMSKSTPKESSTYEPESRTQTTSMVATSIDWEDYKKSTQRILELAGSITKNKFRPSVVELDGRRI